MEVARRDALAAVDVCLRGDHEGAMMVLGSADGLLRVAAFLTAATITDRSALSLVSVVGVSSRPAEVRLYGHGPRASPS